MRLPHVQDLGNADAAVVGAPFDTGASFRAGARFGPEAIRSVSHLLRPYNPSQRVSIFEHLSVIDYGDVPVVPGFIEESYERIADGLGPIHRADLVPTDEVRELGVPAIVERIRGRVGGAKAYVSFDVDFVDPAYAPGTGTPEIGGYP